MYETTRRAVLRASGVAAIATIFGSACSGEDGGQAAPSATTLTIGQQYSANNLDPVKGNGALLMYVWPAYDPLIYLAPDGSLQPRLATSWQYVGEGNKLFEMKLRSGVTFSDGSPLTAAVVKANIEYAKQAGAEVSPRLAPVSAVEVVDDLTVRLRLSTPFPLLPYLFTHIFQCGNMVSGEALTRPETLATQSFGAGQYILDSSATVSGDHYTYTPNPHYWDRAAVRYEKLVVKVLPNPNTALAALKTGQVDVISGDPTTVDGAAKAGLRVTAAPVSFWGLALADRAGDLVPALGDVRVRQAVNYAIDRDKIAKALLGDYGAPAQQIVASGMDGYNDTPFYRYDPAKAKQLLAEAGYADGFTLPVLCITLLNLMAEAVADDLGKVGIKVQMTNRSDAQAYTKDLSGGTFPAYAIGYGMDKIAIMGSGLFLPAASLFNPRKSTDRQIQTWYDQSLAADDNTRADLDKKIVARLTERAWFAPVMYAPQLVFSRDTVDGIQITANRPSPYPLEWKPA